MTEQWRQAPAWQVERWFNTDVALSLDTLRGKVVVLEAFQMLCPGCVMHGLPQAARVRATFPPERVAVVGLHAVFEHHQAMAPAALEAFLHEYRIGFPVGVDRADASSPVPMTMRAYALQGTPTLVLIDAQGCIRYQRFGRVGDLELGAHIATLLAEADAVGAVRSAEDRAVDTTAAHCLPDGCPVNENVDQAGMKTVVGSSRC